MSRLHMECAMNLTARTYAYAFGAVYVVVGLVGFALTGFSGFAATEGPRLILFEINPLHNIVHLLIGGGLLAAAAGGEASARTTTALVAATYAVVGVLGFFLAGSNSLNILALNQPDNFLHLATAAVGALVLSSSRRTVTA